MITIDGGANWNPPPGNATLTGTNINGVAARGQILLVAADNGMYRSDDGGNTFQLISAAPVNSGLLNGRYLDLG